LLGFDQAMLERGRDDLDAGLARAVLKVAGKFCAQQLQPLNREGDERGAIN
jgi:hypothetical protein